MIKVGNWYVPNEHCPKGLEQELLFNIFHCADPLAEAFRYCKKFENAIDIGAWVGDSTLLMAQQFQNVFAFEALPETYNCCVKNIFAYHLQNTIMYNVGLSNKIGVQDFYHSKAGYAGFISEKENTGFEKTQILTSTLDYYNFTDVDFIKIDVDSHEAYVLLGAKKFFENNNPVVMMESKSRIFDRQPDDLPDPHKILEDYGYIRMSKIAKADCVYTRE